MSGCWEEYRKLVFKVVRKEGLDWESCGQLLENTFRVLLDNFEECVADIDTKFLDGFSRILTSRF